jgi:hypothetical protein
MGNTRRFNPSRRQRVLGLKEQVRALNAQNGYLSGQIAAERAIHAASLMERPPDLDEWVAQATQDFDGEERAQWEAMSEDEQAAFIEELGAKINTSRALLDEVEQVEAAE